MNGFVMIIGTLPIMYVLGEGGLSNLNAPKISLLILGVSCYIPIIVSIFDKGSKSLPKGWGRSYTFTIPILGGMIGTFVILIEMLIDSINGVIAFYF